LPAFKPTGKRPTSVEDWISLSFEISDLFDGAPINEEDMFEGRSAEVKRILEAVFARSKHVVLFGERGVGKTSLSNIFWKRFNKMTRSFVVARVQAGPHDNFSSLWLRALEELHASGTAAEKSGFENISTDFETLSPTQIRRELQKCGADSIPIIIIDEYNEVIDADAKRLTANLIKEFYDFSISTTVILVGVSDNISELLGDHASAVRAIVEIPLNRMSERELKEIIQKRAGRTIMEFSGDALWTIIVLSRGLPYFTQTVSKYAALQAIDQKRLVITAEDVEISLSSFIENSETSFKDSYREATRSNQDNNFQQSLLACALADTDDDGFFTANDLVEPYSAIMKEKKRIAHFDKHLRRFSTDAGGNILKKIGGDRQQRFRFTDPMMQPYVIIRGINSKMIDEEAKAILLKREQGVLSI
jgi:Cdc6-like AAA superfamily ATPase